MHKLDVNFNLGVTVNVADMNDHGEIAEAAKAQLIAMVESGEIAQYITFTQEIDSEGREIE